MFSLGFLLFVILINSRSGFEGWIWVLIASVHGLCILSTLTEIFSLACHPGMNFAFLKKKCLKIYLLQALFYHDPHFNFNDTNIAHLLLPYFYQ